MTRTCLALPIALFPTLAFAEPGSGTDLYRVLQQVEAMQRDGRWEQLLKSQSGPASASTGQPDVRAPARPSRPRRTR